MKKSLHSAILIVLAMAFSCPAWAAVSGPCANCHTMHNSQGGSSMALGDPSPDAGFGSLLMNDCVGCHSSDTNWQDPVTGAPIVYNTTEPSSYLAGGNFHWVKTQDAKGHNVFADNPESTLTKAPGDVGFSACMSGCCHANIHEDVTYTGQIRQGCTKCHMMSTAGDQKGYHHADDSNLVVGSAVGDTDGYYRFLSGHYSGEGHGVCGIEDSDWQHTKSASDHNEYLGFVGAHGASASFSSLGHTMTAYCCGCHGNFHIQDSGGQWVRHPSDAVLPSDGEYAAYTTYNPVVPVARPSLTAVSDSVTPGTDMVMCLSCHVPHGSPNDDLLRWDYNGMVAGGGGDDGTGCFVCHTEKD